MFQVAGIKEYKLESLRKLLPSVLDQIDVNTEYLIYNTLFLKDSFKDIKHLFKRYGELVGAAENGSLTEELVTEVKELCARTEVNYLIEEGPTAIQDCLDGLREILKAVTSLRRLMGNNGEKKEMLDLNEALANLTVALKREWKRTCQLVMELDTEVLPISCVKSDLYYVLGTTLLNYALAMAKLSEVDPEQKALLMIKTQQKQDHAEILVRCSVVSEGAGTLNEFLNALWQEDLGALSWVINIQHDGDLDLRSEDPNTCMTIIRLPVGQ